MKFSGSVKTFSRRVEKHFRGLRFLQEGLRIFTRGGDFSGRG